MFGGSYGFTPYSCVFHLLIHLNEYSAKSIGDTVAHELNHTVYYYRHYDDLNNYTLIDEMIMEGLAENFREQVLGGSSLPWAIALGRQDALNILNETKEETLYTRDQDTIKSVLLGNDAYQKWTGYSVGYWLVKEFMKNNSDVSWNALMKMPSQKILQTVKKKQDLV